MMDGEIRHDLRSTWDDVWMEMARTIARRSLCSRAQVGCVIVSADNRVQSAAYNGPVPDYPHHGLKCDHWCPRAMSLQQQLDPEYNDCFATHCENSALTRADWTQLNAGSIYVSGAICKNCAKLICHTGIIRVFHEVHESDAHRDPAGVESFLRQYGREVFRVEPW